MISFQHDKPHVYPLGLENSMSRPLIFSSTEDQAFSPRWLQVESYSILSYVINLQVEIDALRTRLAMLEHERDKLLALHEEQEESITLPLIVERSYPARIVEEIDSPFFLFGGEADE